MSVAPRYPEVGDLVVASVTRVVDYGAYVKLDEYEGVEGLIHISEIASTYVKNIRVHVREGQKLVLKVLRVSSQRAQVDLSLRRVTGREKSEKMLEWKKVKKADSIIKGAAEKLKTTEDDVSKVKSIIYEKFDNPFDAFEEATDEGEEIFSKLGISEEWAKTLTEVARSKIRLEKAKVTGTVELTCARTEGVEAIRQALRGAKKVKKSRGTTIKIYTVGSPRYRLEVRSKEITDAQATLNLAIDEALNSIKSLGGEGRKLS
ncbi:MAG: translation initiation factor IF-2 subunit alpha [Candidatus Bathyarchaeia archaeon]|jgi:translation initiation factor 2 subunit 1